MPDAFIGFARRVVAGSRSNFRFALANAIFVVLVARELVTRTTDD